MEGTPISDKNNLSVRYISQSARIRELEEALWKIRETVVGVPELKMFNYSENDVKRLNNALIEIWDVLEALRKTEAGGG